MSRELKLDSFFDQLHKYFNRDTGIEKDELKAVFHYFRIVQYEKREIILFEGQVENYFSIVMKGVVIKYVTQKNGDMIILQLATEGHYFSSETSFHVRRPSETSFQTLEHTIIIRMSYDNLQDMFDQFPWIEEHARRLMTRMALFKDQRIYSRLAKSQRELYIEYVRNNPEMVQRIPQKYLALYLGIKPETFSRLKKWVYKNKKIVISFWYFITFGS